MRETEKLETVKISDGQGGFIIINKHDLKPEHELFDAPKRKPRKVED